MTPTSAKLWARASRAGPVQIDGVAAESGNAGESAPGLHRPSAADDDLTVQRVVTGLRPGTHYRYRFWQGT